MDEVRLFAFVIVPLAFLASLILFSLVLSVLSGWRLLAQSYPNDSPFDASDWRFAQGSIWRSVALRTNITLRVGADQQFLYLRTWPFNFPGFAELRVPWSDVSAKESTIFFLKIYELSFKQHPQILIAVQEKVWQLVLASVGVTLKNGQTDFPS